jgi:hypothetical protein
MAIASLLVPSAAIPQPDSSWLSSLGGTLGGIAQNVKADRSFNGLADRIGGAQAAQPQQGGFFSRLTGQAPQASAAPAAAPQRSMAVGNIDPSIKTGIVQTASALGISPVDLATAISYETGGTFDPTKGGPTTQWGQHKGLIQFGEPQAKEYGVNWDDPINSQLGENGAVAKYLRATGVQPGMGMMDIYSAINAGGVGRYGASDANNGGAPGTVADKVNGQMSGHRQRALALLGEEANAQAAPTLADAVSAMADGSLASALTGDQPQVPAQAAIQQAAAAQQPAQAQAPMQQAQQGGNIIAPGVTPIARGSVDPELIQYMLRDRNLRETGMQLWAANVQGQKPTEAWQFVNLPDGTLARANQQTGAVERLGNFAKPPEPKSLINMGDGRLFDPNSREVIDAGGDRKKAPNIVELFDEATGQPYKAKWNEETGDYERVGGVKARSGMSLTTNPDGTVTLTEGAVGGMPKLTDSEGRSTGFYGRGIESQKTLNNLEGEGTSVWNNTAGQIPKVGNFLRSENAQKYDQAKRDFINAVLRRESGAVISPEEFSNAEQQYFPQPGDGAEVITQKRRNRDVTIQGLKVSSGQGANFALPQDQQPAAKAPAGPRKTSTGVQWSIEE